MYINSTIQSYTLLPIKFILLLVFLFFCSTVVYVGYFDVVRLVR
jgi:hypothetical protein